MVEKSSMIEVQVCSFGGCKEYGPHRARKRTGETSSGNERRPAPQKSKIYSGRKEQMGSLPSWQC